MKRYKNVSNRHLQFFYAKVEMAPGQEASVPDGAVKEDPGIQKCIEQGYLEEVGTTRRTRQMASKQTQVAKKTEPSTASKENLFDQDSPKETQPSEAEKQDK